MHWRKIPDRLDAENLSAAKTPFASASVTIGVIYTVDDVVVIVTIESVRHRREAYR